MTSSNLVGCKPGHRHRRLLCTRRDRPLSNSENVTTFGMGYHLNQYSPLSQINKSNIKRLVPIWSTSLSNDAGELAQPTVYNGVMYVVNGHWTFALDVATGEQIWRTQVDYERGAARVGQPGVIMRGGATIYDGRLFRETIDCHVVALDMKTGKELWKQKFADYKEGYTGIIAPLVANGVVITGMAGGDRTTRGFLDAWDSETGKKLWRRYTIPAPGEPGSETWPKDMPDAWKYGGGPHGIAEDSVVATLDLQHARSPLSMNSLRMILL